MRVYVNRHPLLESGMACFKKIARPFYCGSQVLGYEVTWSAERADEAANKLMRSVLADLGVVPKT